MGPLKKTSKEKREKTFILVKMRTTTHPPKNKMHHTSKKLAECSLARASDNNKQKTIVLPASADPVRTELTPLCLAGAPAFGGKCVTAAACDFNNNRSSTQQPCPCSPAVTTAIYYHSGKGSKWMLQAQWSGCYRPLDTISALREAGGSALLRMQQLAAEGRR